MAWMEERKPLNATLGWWVYLLVLLMLVCLIVPMTPDMPTAGLDPSWMMAINQAVAQGFAFGKDIVFTFGPYAAVYTHVYHPATDTLALVGAVHVVLGFWLALFALTRRSSWPAMLVLLAGLVLLSWSRDALFLAYPVLAALVCHQLNEDMSPGETSHWPLLLFVALVFSVLGLLPLIKGSMLMACLMAMGMCVWILLLRTDWRMLCVVLLSPWLTAMVYWYAAGQSVGHLSSYLTSMAAIVSGYTDAMSRKGFAHEVILYALTSLGLLWHVWRRRQSGFGLVCILAPALFLAFKAGYVRHDSHAIAAAVFLLFMCVLVMFLQYQSLTQTGGLVWVAFPAVLLMFSAVSVYSIKPEELRTLVVDRARAQGQNVTQFNGLPRSQQLRLMSQTLSVWDVWQLVKQSWAVPFSFSPLWQGAQLRIVNSGTLGVQYQMRMAALRQASPLPPVEGGADMYFADQATLIASGNQWMPRPIFQSYSAYSPELLRKNQAHVMSAMAPAHVFVRLDTMDQRWPTAEDGLSWLTWLQAYKPAGLAHDVLHLQRRSEFVGQSAPLPSVRVQLADAPVRMGESVDVPRYEGAVLVSMSIQPTWWGRLSSLFYQSNPLEVRLTLQDGHQPTFRLVPGQLRTDVLLSPLVSNVQQLASLYGEGADKLAAQRVLSFVVAPVGASAHWQPEFRVTFKQMALPVKP